MAPRKPQNLSQTKKIKIYTAASKSLNLFIFLFFGYFLHSTYVSSISLGTVGFPRPPLNSNYNPNPNVLIKFFHSSIGAGVQQLRIYSE
jgi:hypothetical protein